jgi:hypothetical protein
VKTPPRADFAGHLGRISLLGAVPAIALAAVFIAGSGSRTEWAALAAAVVASLVAAQVIRRSVSHVLNTIANLVSAVHDGDFSVRGKSRRGDDDVAFAFTAINTLADVLREQRLSALEATTLLRKVIEAIDTAIFAFTDKVLTRSVSRRGCPALRRARSWSICPAEKERGISVTAFSDKTGDATRWSSPPTFLAWYARKSGRRGKTSFGS